MREGLIFLDGAMGTLLQVRGLDLGTVPELANIDQAQEVQAVHRAYIEAGSDIIYTNTFGASAYKIRGTGLSVRDLVQAGVKNAQLARGERDVRIALDMGPLGGLMEPAGDISFEEAYGYFYEMVEAGMAGVDLLVFETMSDIQEVKAGILAARDLTDLPILASLTFEEGGRTLTGASIDSAVAALDGLGLEALGLNCSFGPGQALPLARRMAEVSETHLLIKPNAGLPDWEGNYDMGPEGFVKEVAPLVDLGVTFLGGCCGTSPDHIRSLVQAFGSKTRISREVTPLRGPSSGTRVLDLELGPVLVGERINPTGRPDIQEALAKGETGVLVKEALDQVEAGAQVLDINVGLPGLDEAGLMEEAINDIQAVTPTPLMLDSSRIEVLEAGLRAYRGRAIINSVTADRARLEEVLPLARKYNAQVVALTLDEEGLPKTAQGRYDLAKKIVKEAGAYGLNPQDIYVDCLALTVASNPDQVDQTLEAIRMVKEGLGARTLLGVSNVSFGMPNRSLINQTFLARALEAGLDLAICNPLDPGLPKTLAAFRLLKNQEGALEAYMDLEEEEGPSPQENDKSLTLQEALIQGLDEVLAQKVREALKDMEAKEIMEEDLIPALNQVGADYEAGRIFLPHLVKAASAAQAGFRVLQEAIRAQGGPRLNRGRVVLASVKGDVHDIGKNIARVIMENYGYEVIDLGRDVDPETIVETVLKEDIDLVGLSALMTTTLDSMDETIRALKEAKPGISIMVGGAVLTEDYSKNLGADHFLKDAQKNVEVAQGVFDHKKNQD